MDEVKLTVRLFISFFFFFNFFKNFRKEEVLNISKSWYVALWIFFLFTLEKNFRDYLISLHWIFSLKNENFKLSWLILIIYLKMDI